MQLHPWFITGFFEGEGAFTFGRTSNESIAPRISVRQNAKASTDLVHAVRNFFGFGSVYLCKPRPPTEASVYWYTAQIHELRDVVDHFDAFPIQSHAKQQVYLVWRELVSVRYASHGCRELTKAQKPKLNELARTLSSLNLRSRGFRPRSSK